MAFEEAMLGAAIVQAAAAVPGTWKTIRELLSTKKPDVDGALQQLDTLRAQVITFTDMNAWLEEAKLLHERLQDLDTALEPIRNEYFQAIARGPFNFLDYDIRKVRQTWQICKQHSLDKLIALARGLYHIESQILVTNATGNFVSGPYWADRLLSLSSEIEGIFRKYDHGDQTISPLLADNFNQLTEHVKTLMHLADERIRNEALALGKMLAGLAGALKSA